MDRLAPGKRLAAILSPVLTWLPIVVAAWFLARACALVLSSPALPAAPLVSSTPARPVVEAGAAMPPFAHFAALESNNLFNLNSHAPPQAAAPQQRQQAALNAFLMGTVESLLPEDTRAIILHEGTQYTLRPGQGIAGFILKDIRRGTAVFETANGQTVELTSGAFAALPAALPPAPVPAPAAQSQRTREAAAPVVSAAQDPAQGLVIQPPDTQQATPEVASGPAIPLPAAALGASELANMVRRGILAPSENNNGLVVLRAPNNLLLRALGLQQGDVITEVNGKPATIMSDNRQMLRELESGSLSLSLLREGRQESITLRISAQ